MKGSSRRRALNSQASWERFQRSKDEFGARKGEPNSRVGVTKPTRAARKTRRRGK